MSRITTSVFGVLAALIAVAALGLWWFETRWMPVFFAEDAVQVIAYAVNDKCRDDPDTAPEDIDAMIKHLHDASVINLRIDATGKAVDPFGTAFRVDHQIQSGTSITAVTSAGPDRQFGTEDDIQFVHREEAPPRPADRAGRS